ncbi:MAG: aminopeptidase P family protein [Anaerolineae bacterium]|nr:aminopeptidase P family protein [Anaerolineae bacterium]
MLFNQARAAAYMDRCGLDVLVATSYANITYFADYFCWIDPLFKSYMALPGASAELAQAYVVFPREGEPAAVLNPLFLVNAADSWVRDLHFAGDPGLDFSLSPGTLTDAQRRLFDRLQQPSNAATPTDALLSILKARGLTNARIGIDMEGLTPSAKAALIPALSGAQIKDASNLIRLIRMVKSTEEITRLTRAAEISEAAAMESLAMARPGVAVSDLIQHYRKRVAEQGADFDHYAFGVRGMGIATEPHYTFQDDDILYVDFGCKYQYYLSDSGTTLALCPLPGALMDRFKALRACMDAGKAHIRPGAKSSTVRGAMYQTLNDHGITASNPHGHGVGLEVRDYPIIVADNGLHIKDDCIDVPSDLPLETDMVINLEAPLFMPGVASLHLEETFIVTENGCRSLVPQARATPFIPLAM